MQALVESADNLRWRALWLHERGVLARKLGQFEASRTLFLHGRGVVPTTSATGRWARELNSIGNLDGRTGRFSDAVATPRRWRCHARPATRPRPRAAPACSASFYRNLDDEELASRYLLEALDYVESATAG